MSQSLKTFKIKRLDPISPTFCAAKWLTTDIYLHTGVTSSCHFPVPGPIDLDLVEVNSLALHNTKEKIQQRQQMLAGQQPAECSNCWNIENSDNTVTSDRVYYSYYFKDHDFKELDLSDQVVPKTITLMLDNYCNFVCSYCDPTQSTRWATDLKLNGPYRTISDTKKTYLRLGTKDRLDDQQQEKLFTQTVKMLIDNLDQIKLLTLLGGEPTINPKFWKLLELLTKYDTSNLELNVITNFSNSAMITKLLLIRNRFKELNLSISIDGTGRKAEFIRYGLNWQQFNYDVDKLLITYPDVNLHFFGTLNILALDGLVEYCKWYQNLHERWPNRISSKISMIRWPNFQAITVLPYELKTHYKNQIQTWLVNYRDHPGCKMLTIHLEQINAVLDSHESSVLEKTDFKYFVLEYSKRHQLDVKSTFSTELSNWILTKE